MSQLLSGKVKVTLPQNVSEDRYEFLQLNEAEPNLGVPISGSLSSGSVALLASDEFGNRLFVTKLQFPEYSGSFSGSFQGDGSRLTNLPLVKDASRLISGSASASISPQTGFLVNVSSSFDGDMDINGDVRVTGDLYVNNRIVAREILVQIISSSIIFSSGSNRFGNSLVDLQEFTGSVSVTGSFDVNGEGRFSNNVYISNTASASFFEGDGSKLFNLPAAAESPRIVDGAVTASVNESYG
jgi:cytoskeletal protein CcmA (bactofilin family)